MPTSISAPPARVNSTNFIAEYRGRPLPQIAISMYIGINSNSKKMKNRSRSSDKNTPSTAVSSSKSHKKYSRTRVLIRHDANDAAMPSIPVSNTSGALRPSTPMM